MFRTNNIKKDITQTIKDGGGVPNMSYAGNSSARVQPPSATVTAVTALEGGTNTYAANGVDTGNSGVNRRKVVSYEGFVKGLKQNGQVQYSANMDSGGGEVVGNTVPPQNVPVENTVEEPVPVQSTQTESKIEEPVSVQSTPTESKIEENGGDTGSRDTGGGDAGGVVPAIDPLEEYYKNFGTTQEEWLNTTYAANAAIRENAEKDAEAERQRAIVDARSDAELREMSYGANAEALEGIGLSTSGYGDYVGTRSYAQMRGETQNANAQAEHLKRKAADQETLANKEADLTYAANIDANAKEYAAYLKSKSDTDLSYNQTAFNDIYNKVLNGASIEDANVWAAEAGIELTDGQIGLLNSALGSVEREMRVQAIGWAEGGMSSAALTHLSSIYGYGFADAIKIANNREAKQAEVDAKASAYEYAELIGLASAGQVTAEYIEAYCTAAGYSENQKKALKDALNAYDNSEEGKQKQGYIETLIIEASNGMSESAIRALATLWGLSENDISGATGVAKATQTQQQNANYADLMAQLGNDVAAIDAMVQAGQLSSKDAETLTQTVRYNAYMSNIEINGVSADIDTVVKAEGHGEIAPTMYNQLVDRWNSVVKEELSSIETTMTVSGASYPYADLKWIVDKLKPAVNIMSDENKRIYYFLREHVYDEKG